MRILPIFVTALVVLSGSVAWVGAPAIATSQIELTDEDTTKSISQDTDITQTPTEENETTNENDNPQEYQPREVRSSELQNFTLDRSSVPETIGSPSSRDIEAKNSRPAIGTTKVFPALNYDTGQYYIKEYTLRAYSEHGAIWVADNLSWPTNDSRENPNMTDAQVDYLAEEFENNIYQSDVELFGEPDKRYGTDAELSQDGVVPENYYQSSDNKSRNIVLVDNIRDKNYFNESYPLYTAGFYSSVIEDYTDRNVLTMDAYNWDNRLGPKDAPWRSDENGSATAIEGTLTHEFQHLIHSDRDADELSWVNEGLSEYAEYAAGYGMPEGHVNAFEEHPGNSLVEWGDQGELNILADYGVAGLFQMYLDQRYGDSFIKNLVRDQDNGIVSVENTLQEEQTGTDFYSLHQDFSTALVLDSLDDPLRPRPSRYQFEEIDLNVNTSGTNNRTAAWGSSYNTLTPDREPMVTFSADGIDFKPTAWDTVSAPGNGTSSNSGDTVLWGNEGDLTDNFAVIEADLRGTESPTLTFDTYYDIERGWDYGFVQVSTDGGETWTSLSNENTSDYLASPDSAYPPIAENRPGFTGDTGGEWVNESFDLSSYSGQEVLIAFRQTTDYAVNGNSSSIPGTGWYLRDISVPAANISYDGTSTEPFQSLSEVRNEYVNYQFTFIGVTENDLYRVKQLDQQTFENGSEELNRFLRAPIYDRIIFTSTWAARPGKTGTVPYSYDPTYLDEFIDDRFDDRKHGTDRERPSTSETGETAA